MVVNVTLHLILADETNKHVLLQVCAVDKFRSAKATNFRATTTIHSESEANGQKDGTFSCLVPYFLSPSYEGWQDNCAGQIASAK